MVYRDEVPGLEPRETRGTRRRNSDCRTETPLSPRRHGALGPAGFETWEVITTDASVHVCSITTTTKEFLTSCSDLRNYANSESVQNLNFLDLTASLA